jgi:hypothetical protein
MRNKRYKINWDKNGTNHLSQLSERLEKYMFKDRPLVPTYAIPKGKYKFKDKTANELTNAIIQFIKIQGGIGERINSMGRQVDNRQTYTDAVTGTKKTIGSVDWIRGTATEGTADISATVFGLSVKVEVKIGADKQSEAQMKYQERIEQAGGIYIIAKSFDGFIYQFFKAVEGHCHEG